jgi:battenin
MSLCRDILLGVLLIYIDMSLQWDIFMYVLLSPVCVLYYITWMFRSAIIFQFVNIAILLLQIFFAFVPSIWFVYIIILYEGLLGGALYVNTFYRITVEVWKPCQVVKKYVQYIFKICTNSWSDHLYRQRTQSS